ncbi:hypothetical protein NDU88_007007 [Pleurodeles waltl]|uniref:Uncharacterized protein n=1 Tax=Pleurodeles waltl TaxID=8319 RepID=A0AAV7VT25_PLEWA|nr:hypothetical protein NDU88_007007 [Pleurodeles waltl]
MFLPTTIAPFCSGPGTKRYLSLNWPREVAKVPRVHSTSRSGTERHLPAGSPGTGGSEHPLKLLSVSPAPLVPEGPRPGPGLVTRTPFLPLVDLRPYLTRLYHILFGRSLAAPSSTLSARPLPVLRLLDPPCPRADHQTNRVHLTVQAHASQILHSGTLQDASSPPQLWPAQ